MISCSVQPLGRLGRRRRSGFTMIEMLTVIGIIVILMAILLPVVSKVQQQVRVTRTLQQMNKIAGAIDQYYLEFNHQYPGPISNPNLNPTAMLNIAPAGNAPSGSVAVSPTSTENMVLGLCGGLELSGTTVQYNSNDIQSSLGPLNMNPNTARQTRHVAFIDGTPSQQMPDLPWDGVNGRTGVTDSYIPEFMDKFNSYAGGQARPILYLRARIGNPVNAGSTSVATICGNNDTTAQYNYMQLQPYASASDFYGFSPAIGGSGGTTDATQGGTVTSVAPYVVKASTSTTTWDTYLGNPNQFTTPRGVNAYILIDAGPDGVLGTQDDLFYP